MQCCLSKRLEEVSKAKKTRFSINFSWSAAVDWKALTFKYGVGFCLLSVVLGSFGWAKTIRLSEPKAKNRTHWQEHFERPIGALSSCEDEMQSDSEELVPFAAVEFQPNL